MVRTLAAAASTSGTVIEMSARRASLRSKTAGATAAEPSTTFPVPGWAACSEVVAPSARPAAGFDRVSTAAEPAPESAASESPRSPPEHPERATTPIPIARAAAAEVSRRVGRAGVRMVTPSSWVLPLRRPAGRVGSRSGVSIRSRETRRAARGGTRRSSNALHQDPCSGRRVAIVRARSRPATGDKGVSNATNPSARDPRRRARRGCRSRPRARARRRRDRSTSPEGLREPHERHRPGTARVRARRRRRRAPRGVPGHRRRERRHPRRRHPGLRGERRLRRRHPRGRRLGRQHRRVPLHLRGSLDPPAADPGQRHLPDRSVHRQRLRRRDRRRHAGRPPARAREHQHQRVRGGRLRRASPPATIALRPARHVRVRRQGRQRRGGRCRRRHHLQPGQHRGGRPPGPDRRHPRRQRTSSTSPWSVRATPRASPSRRPGRPRRSSSPRPSRVRRRTSSRSCPAPTTTTSSWPARTSTRSRPAPASTTTARARRRCSRSPRTCRRTSRRTPCASPGGARRRPA